MPLNLSLAWAVLLFLLMITLISIILGTFESAIARFRMSHVFEFVFAMSAVALVILSLITIRIYGG